MNEKLKELKEILTKARKYAHAINIMYFDFETIAPKDGMELSFNPAQCVGQVSR